MADSRIQDYSFQMGGGKAFFTLKLENEPWTKWVPVSPAELGAIAVIIGSNRAAYDFDKGILKLLPQGGPGFDKNREELPVLEFIDNDFPKRKS